MILILILKYLSPRSKCHRELIKRNLDKVKHDKIMAFQALYVNFENPDMMRKRRSPHENIKKTIKTTNNLKKRFNN
jgi:hypothetical protein